MATYLVAVHERLHVSFADRFLATLAPRGPEAPVNGDLSVRVELVLAGADGGILRVGMLRTSGVSEFDVGTLAAIQDAGPFGTAPTAIRSFDGSVYVQWTLFRDPTLACNLREAAPLLLAE